MLQQAGRGCRIGVATVALLALAATPIAVAGSVQAEPNGGSPYGVWRSDGYGTVLAVRADEAVEYQVSAAGCVRGPTARRSAADGAVYTSDGERYRLRVGSPSRATQQYAGSPGHRVLHRLDALPQACEEPLADDPLATFDAFWQTFEEQYPFFAAKGIDWHAVRDRLRPQVDEETTDDELFALLRKSVAPLRDAHVSLSDGGDRFFGVGRKGTRIPTPEWDARIAAHIVAHDLGGRSPHSYAGGRISYADLPHSLGYLRVTGFSGYAKDGGYAAQRAALDEALDKIFTRQRTGELRGLVLDVRSNGGGYDALALRLASRLTDRPHLAYAKQARNDPADATRFTRPQPIHVPAGEGPGYTGPVAVLTGGSTVSAGEAFVQSLLTRPHRTVRIGAPTQGVFSDVLERRLPNGWEVGLPNEVFRTADGRSFDGTGIPPHLREPVFTEEELTHGRDSAFDRAVRELNAA